MKLNKEGEMFERSQEGEEKLMGHVRVTRAGYLYFDFYYNGNRHREYTQLKNTSVNMKLMNDAMKKISREIELGTFVLEKFFPREKGGEGLSSTSAISDPSTFREYARRWYKLNKIEWKPSVRKDFSSIMEGHLIPFFSDKELPEINKTMIKEFRLGLSELKGRKNALLSNKRVNNILGVLRLILNEAAEELKLPSPFENLRPLKIAKPEIMPFSLEEVFLFLKTVSKSFHNYYVIRFFTGMRTAEIDGLKWKYIDFVNKKILVRETWQNKQWVGPKTTSSVREIDMSKMVMEALLDQKRASAGKELVFCNQNGKPFDYSNISKRVWYPTLKKSGLASRTPYQTRHTAATLWLASGENPEWIAKQLGHADTQILFQFYSKFVPNLTRKDGSAFERLVTDKMSNFVRIPDQIEPSFRDNSEH